MLYLKESISLCAIGCVHPISTLIRGESLMTDPDLHQELTIKAEQFNNEPDAIPRWHIRGSDGWVIAGDPTMRETKMHHNAAVIADQRIKWRPSASAPMAAKRRPVMPVLELLMIATTYAVVAQRIEVVKFFPALAAPFSVSGLPVNIHYAEFQNIKARTHEENGELQLSVAGEIKNLRSGHNAIADVQVSILAKSGTELFSWVAQLPQKSLKPGEILSFRTRLSAPPSGADRIMLKFVP